LPNISEVLPLAFSCSPSGAEHFLAQLSYLRQAGFS
jgi:hypothetical protein